LSYEEGEISFRGEEKWIYPLKGEQAAFDLSALSFPGIST